ncbi:MAG: hypothetical protein LC790_15055 [Actinobacteria bacterium]|nr:hypothetical protein [Actinomycetota bacterium]MCA1700143.1 hypothetical protein [Actinomycetota bacterium]
MSKVEYVIGGQTLASPAREQTAQMLADDAMALRCGRSPALDRWRAIRDGKTPADTVSAATVARRDDRLRPARAPGERHPPAGLRRRLVSTSWT